MDTEGDEDMREPSPGWESRVRESFARQAFMQMIGAQIRALAPGCCTLALPARPDLAQQRGRRPEHPHRTLWFTVSSAGRLRTSMTSSSVLNCAEGATRMSLKRPLPRAAERTRPTTSPAG